MGFPTFRRPTVLKLIAALAGCTVLLMIYTSYSGGSIYAITRGRERTACSPQAYSNGKWVWDPRTTKKNMTDPMDAHQFSGFEACASSREYKWHLGSDNEPQWNRFPKAQSWKWEPDSNCNIQPLNSVSLAISLVEKGGWLLLGDSITEGHFFSLSCILYPHVIATPNYTPNSYFDRAWPQNLYLNPKSPLASTLSFPPGFNISTTPLVTFRRIDLLLNKADLESLYKTVLPAAEKPLFSEEQFWSMSPSEYMPMFTAPLPEANYATMIVSTAGHWTTSVMSGFLDENKPGKGIYDVIDFFAKAMTQWANDVQHALDATKPLGVDPRQPQRQVIVRAYLPGHEDCHNIYEPWTSILPNKWDWYNWGQIPKYNEVFGSVLAKTKSDNIHFLPIEYPGRLRPDSHATGDCLHIISGAGVLEGWSHYIWHYVTTELGVHIR